MSRRASTAALETFGQRLFGNQRRAPGHPAGKRGSTERKEFESREARRRISQARISAHNEAAMNGKCSQGFGWRMILPVILRSALGALLGSLAFAACGVAQPRVPQYRVVKKFTVHRAEAENLQRWVNAGHETWCRNAELVAAATLKRVAPETVGYELVAASIATERGQTSATRAVYAFHSLEGHTTYRITLRRYAWLRHSAHSTKEMIWTPVQCEKITRGSLE